MKIIKYELSKDKKGLLAYFGKDKGEFYHIHSDALSTQEQHIHKLLLEKQALCETAQVKVQITIGGKEYTAIWPSIATQWQEEDGNKRL